MIAQTTMPLRQKSWKLGRIAATTQPRPWRKLPDTLDREPPHVPGEVQRAEQPTEQIRQSPLCQRRNLRRAPVPPHRARLRVKVRAQAKVDLVADADGLVEAQQNRLDVQNRLGMQFDGSSWRVRQQFAERERELLPVTEVPLRTLRRAFKRCVPTAPRSVQVMVRMFELRFKGELREPPAVP